MANRVLSRLLDHTGKPFDWREYADREELRDEQGYKLTSEDGFLLPHYRTFTAVWNAINKTYRWTWDEAVKNSVTNALAMRRDTFIMGALQERYTAIAGLGWHLEPEDQRNPRQVKGARIMTDVVKRTSRWTDFIWQHCEAIWYGRQANQVAWNARPVNGTHRLVVTDHMPINGDKVQFGFDKTPRIFVSAMWADQLTPEMRGRYIEFPGDDASFGAGPTLYGDRGPMLVLKDPAWRERFVIHKHFCVDADYFDGEMAGGIHGVGLRSLLYWHFDMRLEMLGWTINHMKKIGVGGMLAFYYTDGNAAEKTAADNAARDAGEQFALSIPRPRGTSKETQSMEFFPFNEAGVQALSGFVSDYIERHMERLIIGQTLSSKSEGGGFGGSIAALHADTKYRILKLDAEKLADTLTDQFIAVGQKWNLRGEDYRLRFVFDVPDPAAEIKLKAAQTIVQMGGSVKFAQVMSLAGLEMPDPGDKVLNVAELAKLQQSVQQMVGAPGQGGPGMPGGMPKAPGAPGGALPPHGAQADGATGQPGAMNPPQDKGMGASPGMDIDKAGGPLVDQILAAQENEQPQTYQEEERQLPIDPVLWQQIVAIIPKSKPIGLPAVLGVIDQSIQAVAVDGNAVKLNFDMDFVEGGNGEVYDYVPKDQIWVDWHLDLHEWPFVLYHEAHERRLMMHGLGYAQAHKLANQVEKQLRIADARMRAMPQLHQYSGIEYVAQYAVQHAPAGGADVGGQHFPGGQFIPDEALARATPQEKAALESKLAGQEHPETPQAPQAPQQPQAHPGMQPSANGHAHADQISPEDKQLVPDDQIETMLTHTKALIKPEFHQHVSQALVKFAKMPVKEFRTESGRAFQRSARAGALTQDTIDAAAARLMYKWMANREKIIANKANRPGVPFGNKAGKYLASQVTTKKGPVRPIVHRHVTNAVERTIPTPPAPHAPMAPRKMVGQQLKHEAVGAGKKIASNIITDTLTHLAGMSINKALPKIFGFLPKIIPGKRRQAVLTAQEDVAAVNYVSDFLDFVCDHQGEFPATYADWDETKHPRGQPGNKGEFAKEPGGQGGDETPEEPGNEPPEPQVPPRDRGRAHQILQKVVNREDVSQDEIQELQHHLPALNAQDMRQYKAILQARGGGRGKEAMVGAIHQAARKRVAESAANEAKYNEAVKQMGERVQGITEQAISQHIANAVGSKIGLIAGPEGAKQAADVASQAAAPTIGKVTAEATEVGIGGIGKTFAAPTALATVRTIGTSSSTVAADAAASGGAEAADIAAGKGVAAFALPVAIAVGAIAAAGLAGYGIASLMSDAADEAGEEHAVDSATVVYEQHKQRIHSEAVKAGAEIGAQSAKELHDQGPSTLQWLAAGGLTMACPLIGSMVLGSLVHQQVNAK